MSNNLFALTGQYINSSLYPTLASAVTAASSGGFGLNIDRPWLAVSSVTIALDSVIFTGGSIQPANGQTVTINASVVADVVQLFDLSLGGLIRGTMLCTEVYPEWWGTGSTNCQLASDYVLASGIKTQIIRLTSASYTFTTPWVMSGAAHPNIVGNGHYATFLNFATTSEQPLISIIGTENYSGGSISNVTITDPVNSVTTSGLVSLKISGAVSYRFDIVSQVAKRGVVFYNTNSNFTEYCSGILWAADTTAVACEYRSDGTPSFHGSGLLEGSTINTQAGNPTVLIGTDCKPYESPMYIQVFTQPGSTANAVIFQNNSTQPGWFVGNVGLERFNSGTVTYGGGNSVYLIGGSSFLGDQTQLNSGNFYLIDSVNDSKAGAQITLFKPVNRITTTTSNTVSFPYPSSTNQYLATIDAGGAGYHYIYVGTLTTDEATGYTWSQLANPTSVNSAGYGAPTISAGGSSLTISGSWGSNAIQVAVTFNQIGQGSAHHDN